MNRATVTQIVLGFMGLLFFVLGNDSAGVPCIVGSMVIGALKDRP